jgi:hypothetical protein
VLIFITLPPDLNTSQTNVRQDEDETYLEKIWLGHLESLLERMSRNNLILTIDTHALPDANATTFLNNAIEQHLNSHSLVMPPCTRPPGIIYHGQTLESDNHLRNVWKFVTFGYSRSSQQGDSHQLHAASISYASMTWKNLFSGTKKTDSLGLLRLKNHVTNRPMVWIGTAISLIQKYDY